MSRVQPYHFALTAHGPYAVVAARGELDIAAVPSLRGAVYHAAQRSAAVVVDLRGVRFMDTFALRLLLALSDNARASGTWSLHVVPGERIQRVLDVAGARRRLRWMAAEQLPG